jgi:hypothetical protein
MPFCHIVEQIPVIEDLKHRGAAIFDGITKIVSCALRSGMEPQEALKAFSGIVCSYGRQTCLNAVAEALADVMSPPGPGMDR